MDLSSRGFSGVPFAVDAEGNFKDVDEVPNGLACGCRCADCDTPVVAKNNEGNIRVHHFAHKSRVECWNSLEAALWGMVMRIVQEPGMGISVPAAGYLPLEFPDPRKVVSPGGVDAFRLREWAIPAAVIELSQVEIRSPRIRDAQSTRADISAGGFYICLVHGRRPVDSIQLPLGLKHPVLAIDLGEYAKRWIELCASRADSMREAIHAIEQLRRWLATESTGRRWMVHPQAVKIIERIKAEAETTKLARDEAWRQADAERQLKHQSHVARAKVLYAAQHARAKARREAAQAKQAEIQPRPAPAPAVKDDEFIAWERALCPLCKCQQWRVKAGSRHGPYIGRTILRCSIVVSHPVMILPVGT